MNKSISAILVLTTLNTNVMADVPQEYRKVLCREEIVSVEDLRTGNDWCCGDANGLFVLSFKKVNELDRAILSTPGVYGVEFEKKQGSNKFIETNPEGKPLTLIWNKPSFEITSTTKYRTDISTYECTKFNKK